MLMLKEKKKKPNNQNSYHWAWILSCRPSNLSFCLSSIVCSIKRWLCLSLLCRLAHHVILINNKMRSLSKWTHSEGRRMMGAILWGGLHYIYPHTKPSAETNPLKDNNEYWARKDLTFLYILLSSMITTSRMSCPNSPVSLKCALSGDCSRIRPKSKDFLALTACC